MIQSVYVPLSPGPTQLYSFLMLSACNVEKLGLWMGLSIPLQHPWGDVGNVVPCIYMDGGTDLASDVSH